MPRNRPEPGTAGAVPQHKARPALALGKQQDGKPFLAAHLGAVTQGFQLSPATPRLSEANR